MKGEWMITAAEYRFIVHARLDRFAAAALVLSTAYILFLMTGAIPDDAFITYRTAFNLADHGIYSFNLDEHYPGASSIAFGYLMALFRLVFHEDAILAAGAFDAACSVLAAFFIAQALSADEIDAGRAASRTLWLWVPIGLSPPFLWAGTSGMEMAPILFFASLALRELAFFRFGVLYVCAVFALPFVRIDAIAFALVIAAASLLVRPGAGALSLLAAVAGAGTFATANVLAAGAMLPGTVGAKLVAFHPSHDFAALAGRVRAVLFGDENYLAILAKFMPGFIYAAAGVLFLAIGFFEAIRATRRSFVRRGWRSRFENPADAARLALAASAILVPLAYAYGGVIFPWYLWPSSAFAYAILFGLMADTADAGTPFARQFSAAKRFAHGAAHALVFMLLAVSVTVAINVGYQERIYCTGVGERLRALATPRDTLFLEPAGYIPFYSGLKTFDEVGLASPAVIAFRSRNPKGWWGDFLRARKPTFVIERIDRLMAGEDYWGHPIPKRDLSWFAAHYARIEEFRYADAKRAAPRIDYWLVRLGSREDYVLYKWKG